MPIEEKELSDAQEEVIAYRGGHLQVIACAGRTGLFLQPEINLFGEIYAWLIDGGWLVPEGQGKGRRYKPGPKAQKYATPS